MCRIHLTHFDKEINETQHQNTSEDKTMDSKFHRVRTTEEEDFGPEEKRRIWKNVLILGFAFMLHFTAFWGASNLQSSLNADEALGTLTLASIYASLIISNILLPSFVIKLLSIKWTICLSFITYMPFILAQFYPRFYTMIPAGLLVGLGGGPLWCAKCTYLTIISRAYSKVVGLTQEVVYPKFFGVFFMFYAMSQVWGNLISSAVLSSGQGGNTDLVSENLANASNATSSLFDMMHPEMATDICGAEFCLSNVNASANPNLQPPEPYKIQLIAGIYLACMIGSSVIVGLGMDSMKRYSKDRNEDTKGLSTWKLLSVTCRHMLNPYQVLVLPIMMFIGAEQAFIAADYNAAFVACGWGIENIGFVMICFGVCNAIASNSIGSLTKLLGRSAFIAFGFVLHMVLIFTLLVWQPGSTSKVTYFVISGLWGCCDAIWLVQIHSLSGSLFVGKEEAAYSHFRLWESLGSAITYALSPYLCTSIKLYYISALLILGIAGYTVIECIHGKKSELENKEIIAKGRFQQIDNEDNNKTNRQENAEY